MWVDNGSRLRATLPFPFPVPSAHLRIRGSHAVAASYRVQSRQRWFPMRHRCQHEAAVTVVQYAIIGAPVAELQALL